MVASRIQPSYTSLTNDALWSDPATGATTVNTAADRLIGWGTPEEHPPIASASDQHSNEMRPKRHARLSILPCCLASQRSQVGCLTMRR